MPDSEDSLRNALRELAGQAGPPRFPTGSLIRRAARRRARFTVVSGCCALAVAAAAVGVPVALRGQPAPVKPLIPAASAATGTWGTAFTCGEALPPGLPGATADGLRIAIDSVTRTASGAPAVRWSLDGPGAAPLGPVSAGLLVVAGRTIFAAEQARPPVITALAPGLNVSSAQVYRYAPLIFDGTLGSWASMWRQHQAYRVVIVATVWTEPGTSPVAVRLSATAALPPS